MSKEIEAFGRIALHTEYDNDGSYDSLNFEDDCKLVDNALQRLESIDNSTPSEALECLERLGTWELANSCMETVNESDDYDTIKQALLKAQSDRKELEEYKKLNLPLVKKILENGVWMKGKHNNIYYLSPTDMNIVIKEDYFIIQELYFEDLDCVMDTTGFEVYSSGYKKTWWLKEDKSE